MNRALARPIASLIVLLAAACAQQPSSPPEQVRLRVIAFNDFHGNLEVGALQQLVADPGKPDASLRVPVGGAAPLAGLVKALRAGAPHSLVVSSGDMLGASPLVSTLFRHEPTVEAMNAIGVDVAAAGNHEFDGGSVEFKRLVEGGCTRNDKAGTNASPSCALHAFTGMKFPMLAANIRRADGTPLFAPSWVTQVGTVKVGVIGAITFNTPRVVIPTGIVGLSFEDEADAINRAAAALRAQGVNTILVSIHEGGELGGVNQRVDWNDERCPLFRGRIVALARRITPDVDALLSGHTHQGYRCIVDGRPIVQAASFGRGVSVVDLVIDPATGRVDRSATLSRNLPVMPDSVEPALREAVAAAQGAPWADALRSARADENVAAIVAAYGAAAAPQALREVGRIATRFDRGEQRRESPAGRLVADSQLAATRDPARGGAQIALMNPGGVRADLLCRGTQPCTVTYGDAFAQQPFGNNLVTMTLTGAEFKALLESQQPEGRAEPAYFSHSAGFSYRWRVRAAAGSHVEAMALDGQPVLPEQPLRIVVNNFLAEGGDGFGMLAQGRQRVGGPVDVDAMIDYLVAASAAGPIAISPPRIEVVD